MAADTAAAIGLTYRLLAQAGTVRPNLPERFRIVPIRDSYFNHRRGIRTKTVDDDDPWSAVFLHDPLEKLQRDSPVPS
jgi:hypothetical protein